MFLSRDLKSVPFFCIRGHELLCFLAREPQKLKTLYLILASLALLPKGVAGWLGC